MRRGLSVERFGHDFITSRTGGGGRPVCSAVACVGEERGSETEKTALDIGKSSNVLLRDLRFKNSPRMHIVIKHSKYVFGTNVTVHTPGYIPNTDGIHIQNSEHVYVSDCDIRTGDDYISIGDCTSDIYVEGIHCGPGHGISIGSLGKDGSEDHTENIHIQNVHFRGTNNGVRINTWQGGRGYVKNIIFEDIICHRVLNPITIDQFYSGHELLRILPSALAVEMGSSELVLERPRTYKRQRSTNSPMPGVRRDAAVDLR
ncbi:hypothetical protein MLD38_026721 [Melastoma candidum]|uniref:Uncharacterized protein n=1 Tax=Melastoma candidum TaxID=119954 RepID=A0ACB9P4E9_9MYRT|nr:hypothetical protein MLD38_026721 [Melastoma candidum]